MKNQKINSGDPVPSSQNEIENEMSNNEQNEAFSQTQALESESQTEKKFVRTKKQKTKKSFFREYLSWPFVVLITALIVSFSFGVLSAIALNDSALIIAIVVILVFLVISVITDIFGVAITAVDIKPFRSMSAKKVKGAKEAIVLIKNADKVASIFADIIGDVCGILSGAAGAVVTAFLLQGVTSVTNTILITSFVSAVIAGVIIFGKALGKKFAIINCDAIVLLLGKVVSVVTFNKVGNKKKK